MDICKYPNAKIKLENTGVNYIDFQCLEDLVSCYQYVRKDISNAKLILRPLSSLTEIEKKKLIFDSQSTEIIRIPYENEIQPVTQPCKSDYLRSINIDIDGYKKRGIAIYE